MLLKNIQFGLPILRRFSFRARWGILVAILALAPLLRVASGYADIPNKQISTRRPFVLRFLLGG